MVDLMPNLGDHHPSSDVDDQGRHSAANSAKEARPGPAIQSAAEGLAFVTTNSRSLSLCWEASRWLAGVTQVVMATAAEGHRSRYPDFHPALAHDQPNDRTPVLPSIHHAVDSRSALLGTLRAPVCWQVPGAHGESREGRIAGARGYRRGVAGPADRGAQSANKLESCGQCEHSEHNRA
jgi:hypothetical protein